MSVSDFEINKTSSETPDSLKLEVRSTKEILADLIRRYLSARNELPDIIFDLLYGESVRNYSDIHWTPISVVVQALDFLPKNKKLKILDIGSGAGKFCIVGSLSSNHRFFGIEQREYLVREAKHAKAAFPECRVSLRQGNAFDIEWSNFDVLYFFNPFYESVDPSVRIDNLLPAGGRPYFQSVKRAQTRLKNLPRGTLVLTYYGYGGKMPGGFKLQKFQKLHSGDLALWEKI